MAQITYQNKADINISTTPVQNKVGANDMNEIKNVVNENDTNMGVLSDLLTSNKTSIVNAINSIPEIVVNNNKTSIKFPNGLMINTIQHSYSSVSVSSAWGGVYASGTHTTEDYQTAFTQVFSVNMSAKPSGGNHWFMEIEDNVNQLTTAPKVQFLRGATGTATGTLYITAIGTWK